MTTKNSHPQTEPAPLPDSGATSPVEIIRLIDVGLDDSFAKTASFVQATLAALDPSSEEHRQFDLELVRTRSSRTISAAIQEPAYVLHLIGHGDGATDPGLWSTDDGTGVSIRALADELVENGAGLRHKVVVADGCNTFAEPFQEALAACLAEPCVFVGTTRTVGWWDGSAFEGLLYAALLERPFLQHAAILRRVERAIMGCAAVMPCPYAATVLGPSRSRTALKGTPGHRATEVPSAA